MKFTKVLSLSMIFFSFAAFLSGCGNTTADSQGEAADSQKQSATIKVWAMGEEAKKVADAAKPFEEKTGYKVEVQAIPWDGAHDKLLTAVASKSGPDIIQLGTSWMAEFVDAGAILDMTDSLKDYDNLKSENFFSGSFETTQFAGKTYGIPWYVDTRVLFYRTDILESIGYSEAPKTWEELKDVSAKLRARGSDKYGMSFDPKEQSTVFMLANQAGAKFYGTEPDLNFDSKEFIETVTYMDSFFKDGEVPVDLAIVDPISLMIDDGIAPLMISGPWTINLINENAPQISGKWATAELPKGPVNNDSILGGSNLTIFQYSKNIDASLEFIDYMSSAETQADWFELTSVLPANTKAWDMSEKLSEDPNFMVFGEQLKKAKSLPLIPQFEEIAQTWLINFETIYRGNADIEETVNEFNKKVQEILN